MRLIQISMAARASFRFTSPKTLSEIARRTGAPPPSAASAPGNQRPAPSIRARVWRRERVAPLVSLTADGLPFLMLIS